MKRKSMEVATSSSNATQENLSERLTTRDTVATIRGVNAIVVEWMNSQDGWVLGDAVSATISWFCGADLMEDAYGTYLQRLLLGLRANHPETLERQ